MKKYKYKVLVNLNEEQYKKLEYLQIHLQKHATAKSVVLRKILEKYKISSR